MAEINWRQIAQASAPGNKLIQSGVAGLQDTLGSIAQTADELDQRQTATNTANVMDRIRGLTSTDQFNQAEADKTFGPDALDKYGRNIDANAIRTGLAAQRGVAEQPEKLNIANLLANKDFEGAEEAISSSGIRDKSKLNAARISGMRAEDTYNENQLAKQRAETLRSATLDVNNVLNQQAVDRSANVKKQKQIEQDFIPGYRQGLSKLMSIDSLGELTFKDSPELNASTKRLIQKDYENYLKDNSIKLKTDKERADDLSKKIVSYGGLIPASVVASLKAQQAAFNQSYRKYSHETQIGYDNAVATFTKDNAMGRDLNQRAYQTKIDALPAEVKVPPKGEEVKLGDINNLINADIAASDKQEEEGFAGEFSGDLDPGEKKLIHERFNEVANSKFQYGNEQIAYPAWLVKNAYQTVGVGSFLKQKDFGLKEDVVTTDFENQLKSDMLAWLESEKNQGRRDAAYTEMLEDNAELDKGLIQLMNKAKHEADRLDGKRKNK